MGTEGAAIVKAAKAMEDAADLKTAREAFGALSDAVIAAGTAEGWKDIPDLRVAYCPMVKKSWLQKDDVIKNPYYGSGDAQLRGDQEEDLDRRCRRRCIQRPEHDRGAGDRARHEQRGTPTASRRAPRRPAAAAC